MRIASHIASLALIFACAPALAQNHMLPVPLSGVIGVQEAMFSPDYWVAKAPAPDEVILSKAQNMRMFQTDPTMYDLRKIGPTLSHEEKHKRLERENRSAISVAGQRPWNA